MKDYDVERIDAGEVTKEELKAKLQNLGDDEVLILRLEGDTEDEEA